MNTRLCPEYEKDYVITVERSGARTRMVISKELFDAAENRAYLVGSSVLQTIIHLDYFIVEQQEFGDD